MINKRDLATTVAFLLFLGGFTSLTLSLVGIRWSFLSWIDDIGPLFGFITKVLMILVAIIILASFQTGSDQNAE